MDFLTDLFASAQGGLFETLIQPLMFNLGMGNLLVDGFDATGWLLVGVLQLLVLAGLIGPLQRLLPVEPVSPTLRLVPQACAFGAATK
jgi:C4-dicarboxylate transporter